MGAAPMAPGMPMIPPKSKRKKGVKKGARKIRAHRRKMK